MKSEKEYMQPLEPRLSKSAVIAKSKGVNAGKNPQFRFTVDALYGCEVFRNPKDKHVADLLYELTETDAKGRTYGDRRLSNQCNGTKSFVSEEEEFWYEAGCKGFGADFMSCFQKDEFVRLPMWQLIEKARTSGFTLFWEQIDPVLTLQIMAAGQMDRQPASLTLEPILNARPTAVHGEGSKQFHYDEERATYKLGSPFKLSVSNLRQDEDLLVFEYSATPFKPDLEESMIARGQHMPYVSRAGTSNYAYVTDYEDDDQLRFGSLGELVGSHGFAVLTFPMGSDTGLEVKRALGKGLVDNDRFCRFVALARDWLSRDPKVTLNLTEYDLVR